MSNEYHAWADAEITSLKAELAEAMQGFNRATHRADMANADADLLGRAVYYLPPPNNLDATRAMRAIDARPTAAARVKGGG